MNTTKSNNLDAKTVEGFGDEWERFDQSELSTAERRRIFNCYFSIFPWNELPANAQGFDLGCGSGRWAKEVSPRVAKLHCIDPSSALAVAKRILSDTRNCEFHAASVDSIPLDDGSMDFGYSLGVLHHVPDTAAGIAACVAKLKSGAPFLVYLYYAFDNKPMWFRVMWRASDFLRKVVSRLPHTLRFVASQILAVLVYWPLARGANVLEKLGINVLNIPLSSYRKNSFYTMRTDALDRFGTQLEQRFKKKEIQRMMELAGLDRIRFSDAVPYWCAVGYKK
jgi:ubiquinone/menaquinone biosynthesis C-methylase UbiE